MARGTTETLRKLHRKQLFENSFIVWWWWKWCAELL
jgi:hypothetical protein